MKFFSLVILSAMLSVTACSSHCKKKDSCKDKADCQKECKEGNCEKKAEMCHKDGAPKTEAAPVAAPVEEKKVEKKAKKK